MKEQGLHYELMSFEKESKDKRHRIVIDIEGKRYIGDIEESRGDE